MYNVPNDKYNFILILWCWDELSEVLNCVEGERDIFVRLCGIPARGISYMWYTYSFLFTVDFISPWPAISVCHRYHTSEIRCGLSDRHSLRVHVWIILCTVELWQQGGRIQRTLIRKKYEVQRLVRRKPS